MKVDATVASKAPIWEALPIIDVKMPGCTVKFLSLSFTIQLNLWS